jgi:GTP pyrophosphokinase
MIETIEELIKTAKANGYTNCDVELIEKAYKIALPFCVNKFRYRKPKRPFMNHLISVCAILMNLGINIETVVAGLLHSVKTELPKIYEMNAVVGEIVENYFDASVGKIEKIPFDKLTLIQSAILTIQTANITDMILAREV